MLELKEKDFLATGPIPDTLEEFEDMYGKIKYVSTEEKMLNEIYLKRLAERIDSEVNLDNYNITQGGLLSYFENFHCYLDFFDRDPDTEGMLTATGVYIKPEFFARLHLIVERIVEMKGYVEHYSSLRLYNNYNKHRRLAMRYEYKGMYE